MFFIGGGSLVQHAIHFAQSIGLEVRGLCCPPGDPAGRGLRKTGLRVIESAAPGAAVAKSLAALNGAPVFSINNKHLLDDQLLSSGASFFNVHNGLIQKYRGLSEVCVFAALCRNEEEYGVTLHRILPGQGVDSGSVVDQIEFDVMADDGFADVMDQSLQACRQIFEKNVRRIVQGEFESRVVRTAPKSFRYGDLAALYARADTDARKRAAALGAYRPYFPRLQALVRTG